MKGAEIMHRMRLFLLTVVVVLAAAGSAAAGAPTDPFAGAWVAVDPSDGSSLRLQIGSPSADGVRHVTLTDGYASACGAPASAIGTGTVSGGTLTALLDVRCGGELRAEDVAFAFERSGDTLFGIGTTFVRVTQDEFAGAWTASDPFDGSTLRLQIGSPSASGRRNVTLTDGFASACGAPATAIGTGAVSGSTLTTTVDIRCGGELRAEDVTITYELVGGTLTDGFSTFERTGA
jgi:hypothetical protein